MISICNHLYLIIIVCTFFVLMEKYFLMNGYLPCLCSCHKECLRQDLIRQGYYVKTLKQVSKKVFDRKVKQFLKTYKHSKITITEFN